MADDWNTVTVIGNRGGGRGGGKSAGAVNAARRRGDEVATESKYGAGNFYFCSKSKLNIFFIPLFDIGQNKHTVTSMNTAKLDRETEELKQ